MRRAAPLTVFLLAILAPGIGHSYELKGRVDPPSNIAVFLHGATAPFEASTRADVDGRFQFAKVPAGTYTLALETAARGTLLRTIELSAGTVDSKGRLDIALKIEPSSLEADGSRVTGATVSATVLSIPDRATKEYSAAQHCLESAQPDAACAIGHLVRASEIAPQFTNAWNQLGTLAYQTRRYDDAERYFRKALDTDSDAFEPLVNLGGALLNLNRWQEAIVYNQRAVTRRPNDALANSQLGLNYFGLGNPERAEQYLKTAVRLDPAHFSHPQLTLAEIYIRRGDRAEALNQLRDFLQRHPDSPQAPAVRQKMAALEH